MPESETRSIAKPGKRKFAIAAIVVVFLAAGGLMGAKRYAASHANQPEHPPLARSVMHLDSFVVNLADTGGQSVYLRVGIDVGLTAQPSGESESSAGKDAGRTAMVRDTILGVLMRLSAQDVSSAEGKLRLKQELLRSLQQRLPELGITDVYYTDFLLQS
jgi:flagellar FliL protein